MLLEFSTIYDKFKKKIVIKAVKDVDAFLENSNVYLN